MEDGRWRNWSLFSRCVESNAAIIALRMMISILEKLIPNFNRNSLQCARQSSWPAQLLRRLLSCLVPASTLPGWFDLPFPALFPAATSTYSLILSSYLGVTLASLCTWALGSHQSKDCVTLPTIRLATLCLQYDCVTDRFFWTLESRRFHALFAQVKYGGLVWTVFNSSGEREADTYCSWAPAVSHIQSGGNSVSEFKKISTWKLPRWRCGGWLQFRRCAPTTPMQLLTHSLPGLGSWDLTWWDLITETNRFCLKCPQPNCSFRFPNTPPLKQEMLNKALPLFTNAFIRFATSSLKCQLFFI